MKDKYKKFWMQDKLENIALVTSLQQGDWDIKSYVIKLQKRLGCVTVLDFGCGYGRLFPCFISCPTAYIGVDLNPLAIKKAHQFYPKFKNRFVEVDINSKYASTDMILAFTVFLHLDDNTLKSTLHRLHDSCKKYLVVIEALGREWRPPFQEDNGLPKFNRDKKEYIAIMEECGFVLHEEDKKYNPHYGEQSEYEGFNCYTNILVFKKV